MSSKSATASQSDAKLTASLQSLFSDALKSCSLGDHDRALKSANKILHLCPKGEPVAFQIKIVSLIHLGRYQDVISQLTSDKDGDIRQQFAFEEAFALYRLNRITEALAVLDKVLTPDMRCHELRAQIMYRLELYDACLHLYDNVVSSDEDFHVERTCNRLAAASNRAQLTDGEKPTIPELAEEASASHDYEILYNVSCMSAALGLWSDAWASLERAEDVLSKQLKLEHGEDEDDLVGELHSIRAQKAYVLQNQYMTQSVDVSSTELQSLAHRSRTMYAAVASKVGISDAALLMCVANNLVCWNGTQKIFDSRRRLKTAGISETAMNTNGDFLRLPLAHRHRIGYNNALLAFYGNSDPNQIRSIIQTVREDMDRAKIVPASMYDRLVLLELALDVRQSGSGAKIADLDQLMSVSDLEKFLIRCQTTVDRRDFATLVELVINGISDGSNIALVTNPGLLSFALTLINSSWNADKDKVASCDDLYKKVMQSADKISAPAVWRKMAAHYTTRDQPAVAVQVLEKLHARQPGDMTVVAQLVLQCAKFDMAKAESYRKLLPPPSVDQCRIDVTELVDGVYNFNHIARLAKGFDGAPKSAQPQSPLVRAARQLAQSGDKSKTSKRKKRKPRLPKNLDAPPDPERWLPRKERSGYRKTRRDKRREQGGKFTGAQGGNVDGASALDYSKREHGKTAAEGTKAASNVRTSNKAARNKFAPNKKKANKKNRF